MVAIPTAHSPVCVVCGPRPCCEQPWLEGVLQRVERYRHAGPSGPFDGVHLHLQTTGGPCVLMLGARFTYLADGLQQAPSGIVVRAYHLRRGRVYPPGRDTEGNAAAAIPPGPRRPGGSIPRYLTGPESLVVLEPDWLIDVTALKGTEYCLRQWLANRLAAQPLSVHQVRGTVVHECFQVLCRGGGLSTGAGRIAVARHAIDLALLRAAPADLEEAVAPHLDRLRQWHALYGAALFADPRTVPCFESTLLCPELGLRGRVDLAFRLVAAEDRQLVSRVVELKTGKYNEEWPDPEFQVRGYYAILASQGRLAPEFRAQVIYTGGAVVAYRHVPCGHEHVQDVVAGRNRAVLALLLGHAPPPSSVNKCRKSGSRPDCVRLSTLLGLDHCRGRDLADAAAGDGDPQDAEFYAGQYRLLRLEGRATIHALAALWRSSAEQRIADGTAVAVLQERERRICDGRWHFRLRCDNRSELRAGDSVLLSDGDPVRGEVAVGALLAAGHEEVEVATREPVANPVLIDRYDNGEAQDRTVRGLHAWLQTPDAVRALLYGRRHPTIAPPDKAAVTSAAQDVGAALPGGIDDSALNRRQVEALHLALRTRDYLLVQGPPGTGKTFLIARMVRALAARGERVLLAAWTNQAVDTMLRALLAQHYTDFVRLGSPRAVDPSLTPHLLVPAESDSASPSPGRLAETLRQTPVLAATVSALASPHFTAGALCRDVLILDEAAQLGLAAAVGALRLAGRFILVGDDQQLPPVVQSDEAAREGLSLSPFALLRPEAQAAGAYVFLTEQYRMHAAIAAWPSEAFYAGALVAHPAVAARRLAAGDGSAGGAVADPALPVVLVDAGPLPAREAQLAASAVGALISGGVPAGDIGVVAPFRAAVAAVRRLLERLPGAEACTVDTVDRFQGAQREAMVVCLGLDGIGRRGHAFVDDPRRLNVAFTRARAKLIVIGDLDTAATLPTLAGFLHHCNDHGVPMLRGAEETG